MLSMIVAYDRKRTIGRQNMLPWHIPDDMAYFKKLTTGNTVIMGRKTFESIGKPLTNRVNIVLTGDAGFSKEGVTAVHSLQEITGLEDAIDGEAFIIGGESLYRQALPYAGRLYVTYIDDEFDGDAFFPEIAADQWNLISSTKGEKNEKNPYDYSFLVYERKNH